VALPQGLVCVSRESERSDTTTAVIRSRFSLTLPEVNMRKSVVLTLGGLALVISFMMVAAVAQQQDERDKVPTYVAENAHRSSKEDIGKWVYFVSNDPLMAVFNLDGTPEKVQYTSPIEGKYVVESMNLKYIGDDGTGLYYMYQNDVTAGGLVWFLPKTKRGYVWWMYGGTATPKIIPYGPSVRFSPK